MSDNRDAVYEIVARSNGYLVIRDIGNWDEQFTVTNDAEDVVQRISNTPALLCPDTRLFYYGSGGTLDELLLDWETRYGPGGDAYDEVVRFKGFKYCPCIHHCEIPDYVNRIWPRTAPDAHTRVPPYNGSKDPCDTWYGPCCCGASHQGVDDILPGIRQWALMERVKELEEADVTLALANAEERLGAKEKACKVLKVELADLCNWLERQGKVYKSYQECERLREALKAEPTCSVCGWPLVCGEGTDHVQTRAALKGQESDDGP